MKTVFNSTLPTFAAGAPVVLQANNRGVLRVIMDTGASSQSAGPPSADAVLSGVVAFDTRAFPFVFNGTAWDRVKKPNTVHRLLSAGGTVNATSVKGSAGDLFRIEGFNAKATPVFLKLYNKATAPTVGTDTPILTRYLPPTAYFTIDFPVSLYFPLGIGYALTGAAPDADTTALVAGDILCLNLAYQ